MYCGAPLVPPVIAPPPLGMYQAQQPQQPQRAPRPPGPLSALALASFVISLFFPFGSIVAVVLALIALGRVRTLHQSGRGFAVAGLIIGSLGVLAMVAAALLVFVIGGTTDRSDSSRGRIGSTDSGDVCQVESRTIATAAAAWHAQGSYATTWPTSVDDLVEVGILRRESERYLLEGDGATPPVIVNRPGQCQGEPVPRIG